MKIYNTLTGKKDEFKPIKNKKVNSAGNSNTEYSPINQGEICTNIFFIFIGRFGAFLTKISFSESSSLYINFTSSVANDAAIVNYLF